MSKSDVEQLDGPFIELAQGQHIQFELFDDIPANAVRIREGVILRIKVEVAKLKNGESTVQTLLDLADPRVYQQFHSQNLSDKEARGRCPVEEQVPLEALKTVTVTGQEDKELEVLEKLWGSHVPAIAGKTMQDVVGDNAPQFERVSEDGEKAPITMKELLKDGNSTPFDSNRKSKGRKGKNSRSKVNSPGQEMYLSKRR